MWEDGVLPAWAGAKDPGRMAELVYVPDRRRWAGFAPGYLPRLGRVLEVAGKV